MAITKVEKERIAKIGKTFNAKRYIKNEIEEIRRQVGDKKVLLAMSGGVDSSVCAVLLQKAIGKQLTCVFVDHGCMRLNEAKEIKKVFKGKFGINLIQIDAEKRFLDKTAGVTDPEQKRKIIGGEFVTVFQEEAKARQDRSPRSGHHLSRHHGIGRRRPQGRQGAPQRGRASRRSRL